MTMTTTPSPATALTTIRQADLIESIAAALQFISYYHPADYITHLARAYEREQGPAAKDAIAQILTNSKMSAMGHRPVCQDTGIVNVFLKIGMNVRLEGFDGTLDDAVNEGVRQAYTNVDNPLRGSIVADPQFDRKNTHDNTPAVINVEIVAGNKLDIAVAAKGGGSENKSKLAMLNPGDSIVDWVLKTFINANNYTEKVLLWQTLIHIVFLLSAMAIAYTDKLMSSSEHEAKKLDGRTNND